MSLPTLDELHKLYQQLRAEGTAAAELRARAVAERIEKIENLIIAEIEAKKRMGR